MRSPIEDANAGAATQVAPSKKHATRVATVAKQNNNLALSRAREVNQTASMLGGALDKFMDEKRVTENEQRYMKAYHEQGLKTGLDEYQKDLKKTGFTEFIYGGQTPEYLGALNAAASNASNALMLEEQMYTEGEGIQLTPDQYRERLQDRLTEYNAENFSDAPDAAFAFMSQWKENSNELTRQHFKNHQVYLQEEARRTVAEGFHTSLSLYKTTLATNPNRANELGSKLFNLDTYPTGMAESAKRSLLIDEAITAIQAGDYSALKLINESGLVGSLDIKQLKRYQTAVDVVDTDNFNALEAGRLKYDAAIESGGDVELAAAQLRSTQIQAQARDTGSSKHFKTVYGSDRWRGVLGDKYKKVLEKEKKDWVDREVDILSLDQSQWQKLFDTTHPLLKRKRLADRADEMLMLSNSVDLTEGERLKANELHHDAVTQLNKWTSQEESDKAKLQKDIGKAQEDERLLGIGVTSLLEGNGYQVSDAQSKKKHLAKAVSTVLDRVDGKAEGSTLDRMKAVLSNKATRQQFMRSIDKFGMYAHASTEIKTAITNMSAALYAPSVDNEWTAQQIDNLDALTGIGADNFSLLKAAFPNQDDLASIMFVQDSVVNGAKPEETARRLNLIKTGASKPQPSSVKALQVVSDLGYGSAPQHIQNMAYEKYQLMLPFGDHIAKQYTRNIMKANNPKVLGRTIVNGGTFGEVLGHDLEQVLTTLGKTYNTGGVWKSGLTETLASFGKMSTTKDGETLYNLDQVPDVRISVLEGNIVLEGLGGQRRSIPRSVIEGELNGYIQRERAARDKRAGTK